MKLSGLLGLLLSICPVFGAETSQHQARVDVDSRPKIELKCTGFPKNGSGRNASWVTPSTQYLYIKSGKLSEKWQDFTCSFIPKQSGSLKIRLMGKYAPKIVDGKKLKNFRYCG